MSPTELVILLRLKNQQIAKLEIDLREGTPEGANRASIKLPIALAEREKLDADLKAASEPPDWRPEIPIAEDYYAH